MKLFKCNHCGQSLFFENSFCEKCGYPLGFESETLTLFPLETQENGMVRLYNVKSNTLYSYCSNNQYGVCNWLVPENARISFCVACSLNHTIPNLSKPQYRARWKIIESAKHRLVYSLLRMNLPLVNKSEDSQKGLDFDFIADEPIGGKGKVITGHNKGRITINIAEADDIEREMARKSMDEPYRTVLGHFRHEVGHYYWDRLIDKTNHIQECRDLFGDDRIDYAEALELHYKNGPPLNWNQGFISAYASSHPWEDWAETWAHYLHIIDTLETAYAFGISIHPGVAKTSGGLDTEMWTDPYNLENFDEIISLWLPLTFAMNSLNRSMGLPDPYPFVIQPAVIEKLKFIHHICYSSRIK
jgi:hypothetical protein